MASISRNFRLMQKLIYIQICSLLCFTSVAQLIPKNKTFQFGFTFCAFSGSENPVNSYSKRHGDDPGFLIGSYFKLRLQDRLEINSGFNYMELSSTSTDQANTAFAVGVNRSNAYLEAPFLLKFTQPTPIIPVYVKAGLSASYLINNRYYINGARVNNDSDIRQYRLGIIAGLGIEFQIKKKQTLNLGLLINQGITNIYNGIAIQRNFEIKKSFNRFIGPEICLFF